MHTGNFRFFLQGVLAVAAALLLVLSLGGVVAPRPLGISPLLLAFTGDGQAGPEKPTGSQVASPNQAPPAGPQEEIKVHGDWTIEVRNPDGTLVSRREFRNALAWSSPGPSFLARSNSVGWWVVEFGFGGATPPQPCSGDTAPCIVAEAGYPTYNFWADSDNLKVLIPTTGPNAGKLVLSGSAMVGRDGGIREFRTFVFVCSASDAPAGPCSSSSSASSPWGFSNAYLAQRVPVLAGQIVTVTVVFSFS